MVDLLIGISTIHHIYSTHDKPSTPKPPVHMSELPENWEDGLYDEFLPDEGKGLHQGNAADHVEDVDNAEIAISDAEASNIDGDSGKLKSCLRQSMY